MDYKLLCENLVKSVNGAIKYISEYNLDYKLPVESYNILENHQEVPIVHKLSKKTGYGIYSGGPLDKEVFIAEYIGEKISSQYSTIDSSYVYLTDDNTYVDAKSYGNVARFINHCPHNHTNEDVMTANLAVMLLEVSKRCLK